MNDSINQAASGTPAGPFPDDTRRTNTLLGCVMRVLASNPFYLASAGFLLYGINRLSSDPRLAGPEHSQLVFNFCALFAYEILLVITAIVLARRSIWYDALLLVSLENFFVLVPFSLVSRAVLLDQGLAWVMCVAGMILAGVKFWALKRWIPELGLSRRVLLLGAVVMIANVSLALGLPRLELNRTALLHLLPLIWVFGLPVLGSLLYWLASPGTTSSGRKWFAQALFALGTFLALTKPKWKGALRSRSQRTV